MYDDDNKNSGRSMPMYGGRWWNAQVEEAEKELEEKFWSRGKTVIDRYTDERDDSLPSEGKRSKYNMFWANTQILKSALYAVPPKPTVMRENADSKDDVARTSALMLERILQQGMTKSKSDSHEAIKAAVEDRLLPGLGQVWARYESETEEFTLPAPMSPLTGLPMGPDVKGERIVSEKVCTDYVNWRDFLWSPARRWNDVWWVARRVWMKKNAFKKRFGSKADAIWLDIRNANSDTNKNSEMLPKGFRKNRAEIFEIWCEATMKVYFVSKALDEVIERIDDPLQLSEFWPCPKPLLATHTNESLIPVPDYCMVQDQYEELDTLNTRIAALTRALRVVGAYDSSNAELKSMLTGPEMAMIPVENWAALGEQGGMARAVDWFPVDTIAKVLGELTQQRTMVVSQIYELTSISDIMRGASNPRETAKAQQLKAQYSSVRLQLTQQDVAGFVQDLLRIKAEIVCRHFQPETLIKQSQIEQSESAQFAGEAVKLLKDFDAAEYRIDVSEESLSMADYNAERQMRIELITAVGQFFSQAGAMVEAQPGALPYMLKIVQWVVASFRGSKDIEAVLDQAIEAAKNAPPQQDAAPPPPPDYSVEVAKIKAAAEQAKTAADKEINDAKLASEERLTDKKIQADERIRQLEEQSAIELARAKAEENVRLGLNKTIGEVGKELTSAAQETSGSFAGEMTEVLKGLTKAFEEQGEALSNTTETLQALLENSNKPRKRTPVRDKNGEILYVNDTAGE